MLWKAHCYVLNVTRKGEVLCGGPYLVARVLIPGGMRVLFLTTVDWVLVLAVFTEDCRLTPVRRVWEVPLLSRSMRMISPGRMGDVLPLSC
jgi:hypothetical protein